MGEKTVRALLHRLRGPYVGALNRSRLLGVIRDRVEPAASPAMSAMARQRPNYSVQRHVAMGQNRTHAPQQKGFLFDDLVRELLEMRRHVDAKRICCL